MSHRPRLLIITPDFPPDHGGIQLLAHRLATGLRSFQTRVVTHDGPGANRFDAGEAVSIRRVPAGRQFRAAPNLALNAIAVLETRRFRPDVVLSAHIVTSPAAALIHRLRGVPTLQYFYAMEIAAKPRLAAFAARSAQDVVAISAYTARLVAETGTFPAKVHLIAPGVDISADSPMASGPAPDERPTFLTVARLEDRYKGHDVLIKALPLIRAKVPDVRWVVIGDGSLRPELEGLARAFGVAEAISFLGAVSDDQRDRWLARTHLLAMPSRLPGGRGAGEGFGIAYMEAASHGRPVVAGNVGGALDAVIDGQTGLLVDPTDHVAVAEAVTSLLLDRALARALGDAGAIHAREFAWPAICARVEAVLLTRLGLPSPALPGALVCTDDRDSER